MTKTVFSTVEHLRTEVEHIKEVLTNCKYPACTSEHMKYKNFHQSRPNNINNNTNNSNQKNNKRSYIVIPYVQGLCKGIKNICGKYTINAYFKVNETIKNILVSPKIKDPIQQKCYIIYWYQ